MQMMEEKILPQIRYLAGEDVSRIKSQGISIDNESEPAIENIPLPGQSNEKETIGIFETQQFGWVELIIKQKKGT